MGYRYKDFIEGKNVYCCRKCRTHLISKDQLVSKSYQGRFGRAHLYNKAINVVEGEAEERSMTTGVHVVCDLKCAICGTYIGWKYISAFEKDQKFKEGKYIIEKGMVSILR